MIGSRRDLLKICCCIAASRWLMLSETSVGTRSGDTTGCCTRTKVCDVKRFGKMYDNANPDVPPISVIRVMSTHLRRRMIITSLALMSWRNIHAHFLLTGPSDVTEIVSKNIHNKSPSTPSEVRGQSPLTANSTPRLHRSAIQLLVWSRVGMNRL